MSNACAGMSGIPVFTPGSIASSSPNGLAMSLKRSPKGSPGASGIDLYVLRETRTTAPCTVCPALRDLSERWLWLSVYAPMPCVGREPLFVRHEPECN